MLPYAGYVNPESTLAIGVHHDGHFEDTERTFCSLYHIFIFGFTPFAVHPRRLLFPGNNKKSTRRQPCVARSTRREQIEQLLGVTSTSVHHQGRGDLRAFTPLKQIYQMKNGSQNDKFD
tara:strand:+ start:68 stop:424 length:357 start_codon:yes stop_codon:yes gene_type:complete